MGKLKGEFVIDRKKWLTGEAVEESAVDLSVLLDQRTGLMCCLGQACRQLGFKNYTIEARGEPIELVKAGVEDANKVKAAGFGRGRESTKTARALMQVNDNAELSREDRESIIRRLFRKIGWKITYKGKYPDYTRIASARI